MKPSKKLIYNDCLVKGNVVTVELTNQTLAEKGVVACQLEFNETVSSYEFALNVDRDLSGNGIESKNESTVLDALLEELRQAIAETKSATETAKKAAEDAKEAAEDARKATQESVNPIKEVKGSFITADGTFQGSAIIKELNGGTKQATTKGYQLFDASKLPTKTQGGATVTNNGDGSFTISGSGDITGNFTAIYTINNIDTINKLFKNGKIMSKPTGINPRFYIYGMDEEKNVLFSTSSNTGESEINDISAVSFINIVFFGSSGAITPTTIKPMIYQDGDGTWEPFTGGVPYPSPDYPQEIKAIGGEGDDKISIEVKSNGTNLLDVNNPFVLTNATIMDEYNYTLKSNFANQYYSNIVTKDARHLKFIFDNMGKRINFKCELLKGTNKAVEIVIYGNRKNGGTYQIIAGDLTASSLIYTDFINIKQLEFRWNRKVTAFTDKDSVYTNLMAWIGEDEPDFQPHKSSTAYIPLDSPLYEGDKIYLEDGELWEYRENARVVFDGSEDEKWLSFASPGSINQFYIMHPEILHINEPNIVCDKLKADVINNRNGNFNIIYTGFEAICMNIDESIVASGSLTAFKNWLQSNPLEVIYKLETPTRKKLGSVEAFNLRTFDGVTYIEVVGSQELGTENTFIVPRNQSGGIMTDAFATAKRNELKMAEQVNLASRLSSLEKLAVKEM